MQAILARDHPTFLLPLGSTGTPRHIARRAAVLLGEACLCLIDQPLPPHALAPEATARLRKAHRRGILNMCRTQKDAAGLIDCAYSAAREGDMRCARDAFQAAAALGA